MSEKHRVVLIIPLEIETREEQWETVNKIADLKLPTMIGQVHIAADEKADEVDALVKSWDLIKDETYYNENTLFKVNIALQESGLTLDQARDAISEMQNAGILFRERI